MCYTYLSDGKTTIKVVFPHKTKERLRTTCFRPGAQLAGNFFRWKRPEDVLEDPVVREQLLEGLLKAIAEEDWETTSIEVVHADEVGWCSTAPRERFRNYHVQAFKPNVRSTGLKVKSAFSRIRAPRTTLCTFVLRVHPGETYSAVVYSLYPGRDIGELEGDVSEREGVVFFDWAHPGA